MLQNSKVSDRELIEALVQEFHEIVYQAAKVHFGDSELACQAAVQALAVAVANRQQYWGSIPLPEWTLQNAEKVFQSLDREKERLKLTSLPAIPDPAGRDAWTDLIEAAVVQQQQKRNISRFIPLASMIGAFILVVAGFLWWISQPERDPNYLPPDQVRFYYKYTAQPGDSLESIARFAGVSTEAIKALNSGINFASFQQDVIRDKDRASYDVRLPVLKPNLSLLVRLQSKLPRFQPLQELNQQSSSSAIMQRIRKSGSSWRSLRADFWMTYYGVPGYLGRPSQYEFRMWVRKPGQMRWLAFYLDRSVSFAEFMDGNRYYGINPMTNEVFLTHVSQNEIDPMNRLYPEYTGIENIRDGELKVLGAEKVAGRDALVVDWFSAGGQRAYRLWVDSWMGIILAWRGYGADGESPAIDMTMASLQINGTIDDQVFDPSKGVFINNSDIPGVQTGPLLFTSSLQWGPMPAPRTIMQPPPPGFDPAESQLAIQWPWDNHILSPQQDPELKNQIKVFAGNYYLGLLDFRVQSAYFLNCTRSPDGRLVAISLNTGTDLPGNHLYWFPADWPGRLIMLNSGSPNSLSMIGAMAFSPDSHRLAFSGCVSQTTTCGLYIRDLFSPRADSLVNITGSALLLSWSPDGKRIAFVTPPGGSAGSSQLSIFSVDGLNQLYSSPFDMITLQPPADAPLQGWKIDFSSIAYGGRGCAAP